MSKNGQMSNTCMLKILYQNLLEVVPVDGIAVPLSFWSCLIAPLQLYLFKKFKQGKEI